MDTLDSPYLNTDVANAAIIDDRLHITLADGQRYLLPLWVLGQFDANYPVPDEAQIIVLHHPPQIRSVAVDDEVLTVQLTDGRSLVTPISWFPRLIHATQEERNNYELHGDDQMIHWPALDEDIDVERLLIGGPSAENETSIRRWLASRRQLA